MIDKRRKELIESLTRNELMLLNELIRLHKEYGSNDMFYINIYSTMYGYALSNDTPYDMSIHTKLMSMSL